MTNPRSLESIKILALWHPVILYRATLTRLCRGLHNETDARPRGVPRRAARTGRSRGPRRGSDCHRSPGSFRASSPGNQVEIEAQMSWNPEARVGVLLRGRDRTARQGIPPPDSSSKGCGISSPRGRIECTGLSARLERPCRLSSGEGSRRQPEPPRSYEHDDGTPRRRSSHASCPE